MGSETGHHWGVPGDDRGDVLSRTAGVVPLVKFALGVVVGAAVVLILTWNL